MKRSEHLKKLSWEHHDALKFARRINKGMSNGTDPEQIARYVVFIVDTLLQPHFDLEEQSLIGRLDTAQAQDIAVTQVIEDHQKFIRLVDAIREPADDLKSLLESFVDLLKQHVKWEEQRFFPYCEKTLSPQDLEQISRELDQGHIPDSVTWDEPFWN
ncbi:hemerythrin domain-containing protein [Sedimenticola sp.]|uniref:hemerythrin domain-containing protein n=1 Tax=Sedimenticola sp. TaxID=1940285 RepID=UPI003D11CB56